MRKIAKPDRKVLVDPSFFWTGRNKLGYATRSGDASGDAMFCGGGDSAAFRQGGPPPTYLRRDEGIRRYTAKQNKCWKPVIAAVNGLVVGPGLHFLLDADICIAVPEARFCDAHMHHTGSVPVIEPIEMARRIPHEAVSRMFLLGPHDPIDAARAYHLGLISEIVPRDRNRQARKDRLAASLDYEVNLRTELEILGMRERIDLAIDQRLEKVLLLLEERLPERQER